VFGEGGGQAIVACAREDVPRLEGVPVREIGEVGGDELAGIKLSELREAYG
jgi:hypothetical protein